MYSFVLTTTPTLTYIYTHSISFRTPPQTQCQMNIKSFHSFVIFTDKLAPFPSPCLTSSTIIAVIKRNIDHYVFVHDFRNTDHRLTPKTPDEHEWWCPYGIQIEIIPLPENGSSRKSSTSSSRKTSHSKLEISFSVPSETAK